MLLEISMPKQARKTFLNRQLDSESLYEINNDVGVRVVHFAEIKFHSQKYNVPTL
jgi:hypothetical protein